MRQEPPPSNWAFPPLAGAEPQGPIAVGGDLEPGTLLDAYRRGLFPMPVDRRGRLGWWSPDPRAILPVHAMHLSRSARRSARSMQVTVNRCFTDVMIGCANPSRPHGWINAEFVSAYTTLHKLGWAHSVEVWIDTQLVGGVYGISIGDLFAGESMFHTVSDASKVALHHLCQLLEPAPKALFDVQWLTPHLASLGAIEIDRTDYLDRLKAAVGRPNHELL